MYYWLLGTINPFLFFCLSPKLKTRQNAMPVVWGLCFLILFKILDTEPAALLTTQGKSDSSHTSPSYEYSAPQGTDFGVPKETHGNSTFLNCVRLRGQSGQIEDKVLLFYNYKTLTRLLILPLFWFLALIFEPRFKLIYAEMLSVIFTVFSFPVEISGLGLFRVILWCGPLFIMRDFFGFYGRRALIFNLVVLSILCPLTFEKNSSLVMIAILISIHTLLVNKPLLTQFLLGNLVVSFLIGVGQEKMNFLEILISPLFELVGYLFNGIRYFHIEPDFAESFIRWFCGWTLPNFYVLIPAELSVYFFKVLISALLLGCLKPVSGLKSSEV